MIHHSGYGLPRDTMSQADHINSPLYVPSEVSSLNPQEIPRSTQQWQMALDIACRQPIDQTVSHQRRSENVFPACQENSQGLHVDFELSWRPAQAVFEV